MPKEIFEVVEKDFIYQTGHSILCRDTGRKMR